MRCFKAFCILTTSFVLFSNPMSQAAAGETESSQSFHLMMIKEIFPGSAAAPNAQYIQLQMYSVGQNLTAGTQVRVFNSTGVLINTFTLNNVANGANQATVLLATPQALAFFSLPVSDDTMAIAPIPLQGGKICFHDPAFFGDIDCFSWGNFTGSSVGSGNPFNAPQGLNRTMAARRRTDICFNPTVLDPCDDTNNSLTDFFFVAPTAPRNNAGNTGTIPPATCGNGTLEGLEPCDDNNTEDCDGCSSVCQIEPDKGDLDDNTILDATDVVLMLNCVFLGIGNCGCHTDIDCSGGLPDATDVVLLLNTVFLGDPLPC